MQLRPILQEKSSIVETLKYNPWAKWLSTIGLIASGVICWWLIKIII